MPKGSSQAPPTGLEPAGTWLRQETRCWVGEKGTRVLAAIFGSSGSEQLSVVRPEAVCRWKALRVRWSMSFLRGMAWGATLRRRGFGRVFRICQSRCCQPRSIGCEGSPPFGPWIDDKKCSGGRGRGEVRLASDRVVGDRGVPRLRCCRPCPWKTWLAGRVARHEQPGYPLCRIRPSGQLQGGVWKARALCS
jgi:hypothetical protein